MSSLAISSGLREGTKLCVPAETPFCVCTGPMRGLAQVIWLDADASHVLTQQRHHDTCQAAALVQKQPYHLAAYAVKAIRSWASQD